MKKINKEHWMTYRDCRQTAWLLFNRPEIFPKPDYERLKELKDGIAVDGFAREACQNSRFIEWLGLDGFEIHTQFAAETEACVAKADIVGIKGQTVYLFEVKASKAKDEMAKKCLLDVAFQAYVLSLKGYTVAKVCLIGLNPAFTYDADPIDPTHFFSCIDVSVEAQALWPELAQDMAAMQDFFRGGTPALTPHVCAKKADCIVLQTYFREKISDTSIFTISRLQRSKLQKLVDQNIWDIKDVPADFPLSENQKIQVETVKNQTVAIDQAHIQQWMSDCRYPLYFLDYETVNMVFPFQKGFKPYDQMVFQFSLHILDAPGAPLKHVEYLLESSHTPVEALLAVLKNHITDFSGNVIVWNAKFESVRNREMAALFPSYQSFLLKVNECMRDLADPFEKKWYVHPAFKGRYSIKYVLPVLVPELSYTDLAVQNGTEAVGVWLDMISETDNVRKKKYYDELLAYCRLDTLAMYMIFKELEKV